MKILSLYYDEGCDSPADNDGAWTLYSFSHRHRSYANPEKFFPDGKPTIGLRSKLRVGLAFVLSYYEHGGCVWSLRGEGPQCRWDSVDVAGLLVWEHSPKDMGAKALADRRKDAQLFLDVYNAWCNGEIFGYTVENVVTLDCGHTEREVVDSCSGYYGTEGDLKYMFEQVREALGGDKDVKVEGSASGLADYHLQLERTPCVACGRLAGHAPGCEEIAARHASGIGSGEE